MKKTILIAAALLSVTTVSAGIFAFAKIENVSVKPSQNPTPDEISLRMDRLRKNITEKH